MQFPASDILKPYVKYYWVYTTDSDVMNEVLFYGGYVALAINISGGNVITTINGHATNMPKIEILGQLTLPTRITATKETVILIARFYPYATSLFFPNPISDFTNYSVDFDDVCVEATNQFYDNLTQADSMEQKVGILDAFLIQRLGKNEKRNQKIKMIEQICDRICVEGEAFNAKDLSGECRFSERYIQRLFTENVGLPPRSFFNIHRFNKSLELIRSSDSSLTSIAYDCGYYDQAHFIKEFKKYTGMTPSEIRVSA
jgi:AraC-like DNA-binding protein